MHEMSLYARILESNLINFIIMVSILVLIFKKAKLGTIFDKMANDIKTSVMTSSEAAQAALREYKEAKKSTKNLVERKKEIIECANTAALNAENTANEMLLKEKEMLDIQLKNRLEYDTLKAKEDFAREFMDIVVELSKDEIQNRLNSTDGAELQSKLIDKCIENIDKIDFSEVKI